MRARAIVIKKQNSNEYDQLITCYTREFGKLTAVAKSVLKNNSIQAMHLDVLNMVDFELVTGRSMPIIASAQLENGYCHLKKSLARLAMSYFFIEVIDKFVFDNERDDIFWNFLTDILDGLDRNTVLSDDEMSVFFRKKQAEFLAIMGHAPNMAECTKCYRPAKGNYTAYSVELGGVLCPDCFLAGNRGVIVRKGPDFSSSTESRDRKIEDPRFASSGFAGRANRDGDNISEIIFENIGGKKLESLSFINSVVK